MSYVLTPDSDDLFTGISLEDTAFYTDFYIPINLKEPIIFSVAEYSDGDARIQEEKFLIGSMSKSFTALSIMQLVEQGKINLDEPIATYLNCSDYFKNSEDGNQITVRQLLNQNSGLDEYQRFGTASITDMYGKYEYANINYGLLGEIIENVSGESYSAYVENYIFEPLEMNHTSATLEDNQADMGKYLQMYLNNGENILSEYKIKIPS